MQKPYRRSKRDRLVPFAGKRTAHVHELQRGMPEEQSHTTFYFNGSVIMDCTILHDFEVWRPGTYHVRGSHLSQCFRRDGQYLWLS
ncbi:hypothetical protein Y032_0004g1954 [Ancylostoma ceylanicum]|uniref:Uncharacterized protein n=1 Tax=Ancylostoma ceylanicum TaxID=53326 RepID=A0A016VVQ7_9BILA|nr:hypothetical protein Y032_0004g1954 [Ancylostoma ceylanicum]